MQAAVITFDHLAPAFVGCYGNPSIQTPNFDDLASRSVVFDNCFGTARDRDPFEGLTHVADALRASGGRAVVQLCRPGDPPWSALSAGIADWMRLSRDGTPALLWLRCSAVESPWSAPVDRIVTSWNASHPAHELPLALADCGFAMADARMSAEDLLTAAWPCLMNEDRLSRNRMAATPLVGRLRRCVYAAAVTMLDAWLGEVLTLLSDGGDSTRLLVVAAGAGDLTGPHAALRAGCPPLIDSLLHVPLLIRTGTPADGTRRGGLVSTIDLAPTLAERLLRETTAGTQPESQSLWPLLNDDAHAVRNQLLIGSPATGWNLRTPEFACLCAPEQAAQDEGADHIRLFVKPDDAWDTLDVAGQYQATADELSRRIRTAARGELHGPGVR